jgi:hypothetical protein
MAKPFTIRVNSISAQPLSVEETAEKYGVSAGELKRVRSFLRRDTSFGGKAVVVSRNHATPARKSRGHK